MGQSARVDKCRCIKCYKAAGNEVYKKFRDVSWQNITPVKMSGTGVLLECGNCGHRYKSYSSAAYRLATIYLKK